ncbi:V-type ATP synthase subunit E [Anaerosporobacter sp.]|uniref:V-type ATP synthase subunit E n=1 Tax=Anaerosporobacter sp. TaxID=1872529 RepID=UPI00286F525E|nr:V-type ATP synthase subunit E [Anaerosporobacter sp.]
MTLDEKLDYFYQSAINDATIQSSNILESYENSLKEMIAEKKEDLKKQAEQKLRTESGNLVREKNKNLSNEALNIKRTVSEKTREKVDGLFADVKNKLSAYMQTPEYQSFLITKINEAIAFAKDNELIIYINPTDTHLKTALEAATHVETTISNIDFFGGIRCVIPERHILIDNSFMSKLEEEKANFKL